MTPLQMFCICTIIHLIHITATSIINIMVFLDILEKVFCLEGVDILLEIVFCLEELDIPLEIIFCLEGVDILLEIIFCLEGLDILLEIIFDQEEDILYTEVWPEDQ